MGTTGVDKKYFVKVLHIMRVISKLSQETYSANNFFLFIKHVRRWDITFDVDRVNRVSLSTYENIDFKVGHFN